MAMAIGIVGNYGNNNKGDEAILQGIIIQLKKYYHISPADIVVFSNHPEQTRKMYGVQAAPLYYKKNNNYLTLVTTMRKNFSVIKKLDLLIVGGGGILMDLYGSEAFLFGMYGWLGKLTKTPVVIYGVGAGPILSKQGELLLRSLAHIARLTTVRDPESKKLLQSIGVKSPIHVIGDPAFQLPMPIEVNRQKKPLKIGVTAVPFYHGSYWPEENLSLYQNYITGMAENLDRILHNYPNVEVNFFATKYPQDLMVTKEIKALMQYKDRCTINEHVMEPNDIVGFAAEQDIVIGTRLHSLILSLVSETPVIAVSYHHKVLDFMNMIECQDYVVPIEGLHDQTDLFLRPFEQMDKDWDKTTSMFKQVADKMKYKADKGMQLVKQQTENKNNPNVLVLSNMYPSKYSKTFGIFVKNQVELLQEKGVTVDVSAISDPRKGKIRVISKYLSFFVKNIGTLLFKGGKYDAVHVHYIFPTGLIGLLYKRLFNTRLIVTSHGGDIDQMIRKSSRARRYTDQILQQSDHVIAVGDKLKQDIHENFSVELDKISVINMGVNRDVFHPIDQQTVRRQLGIAPEEKLLLFVGNLIEAKGLMDLVDAFKLVKQYEQKAALHLIGEPKNAAFFKKLKETIADERDITIHDALPQQEIAQWMSAADIFVLPSHIEGFGLVALEAMACEIPVVGTNIGGLTYLLDEGRGLKAEVKNPEGLAKQIITLLGDPELKKQIIKRALRKVEEYDQQKLVDDVIKLYTIRKA
ncbi:polysaccharide pyruvyl transferase family protein [Aquibacillus salsiterrae]|uniref:Polysaccharide pyruvyl transferase family protein n=1 Tax=Aquibacillus salsiterrae TaxID=2950439 RepID=A0A9X3WC54_9BACI|nr:polysaccharide pyruvyl transferase family protein [Aquibacillus salsiterrae]MDC3416113.1 polysaccharide pyruvyl transferase family protein [Aquibacillus salsiterrae]